VICRLCHPSGELYIAEHFIKYGKADRIWCSDRGMMSDANIEFLKQENRKYIIGTSKETLKKFEQELLKKDWKTIREGAEVKLCPFEQKTCILCRNRDRRAKEKSMHERFVVRMEKELEKTKASCEKRKNKKEVIDRRVGRIKCKNSRCASLFDIKVTKNKETKRAEISWTKKDS
jgi:transposase